MNITTYGHENAPSLGRCCGDTAHPDGVFDIAPRTVLAMKCVGRIYQMCHSIRLAFRDCHDHRTENKTWAFWSIRLKFRSVLASIPLRQASPCPGFIGAVVGRMSSWRILTVPGLWMWNLLHAFVHAAKPPLYTITGGDSWRRYKCVS